MGTVFRDEVKGMKLADAWKPFKSEMHEALQGLDEPGRKRVLDSLQLLPPSAPGCEPPGGTTPSLIKMRVWY